MKAKRHIAFIVFLFLSVVALAQQTEFKIINNAGQPLPGVVLSKYNAIGSVSDGTGTMKLPAIDILCRLHLTGYRDTFVRVSPELKQVVLQRNLNEPVRAFTFHYRSPLPVTLFNRINSNFNITPKEEFAAQDTIFEKVLRFNVDSVSVPGVLMIPVAYTGKDVKYANFDLALYNDKDGLSGEVLIRSNISALYNNRVMVFNLFEHQIPLTPGTYYIGYRKKINELHFSERLKRSYDENFIDKKASNGEPTFYRTNYGLWKPLLMERSKPGKLKYYTYAHVLQLIKVN